jgi:DnaK suppressor protein
MTAFTASKQAKVTAAIDARDRQLRDELRDELVQSGVEKYIDLAGSVHDLADEAVADELVDVENALIQRHVQELLALETARKRLAEGTIDECVDCGDEVGLKRLLANPAAVRCTGCQGRFERIHAHEATPSM